MSQLVKNLPAMQETWVQSLGWGDPLEEGTREALYSNNLLPNLSSSVQLQKTIYCNVLLCLLTLKFISAGYFNPLGKI